MNETQINYWQDRCLNDPSLPICDSVPSFYGYRISIAANAAFLALFSLSLLAYIATYAATRRGLAFLVALSLGLLCEIIGYAGRIMSWQNQWTETGFLMQICCLTIGPAYMAAGIYLCLRRIVYAFGPENSRIPPEYYTRIVRTPPYPHPTIQAHTCVRLDADRGPAAIVHPLRRHLAPAAGRRRRHRVGGLAQRHVGRPG